MNGQDINNDTYTYDAVGNPTSFAGTAHSYNGNNQLADQGFQYDARGNAVTYAGVTCTYTPDNRLASFGNLLTAGYRGDGLRAWQESGAVTTYYVYDGDTMVCEIILRYSREVTQVI